MKDGITSNTISLNSVEYTVQEFDKHRKLFIQDVPPVTHQDVRQYLGDIVPADIVISKRLQHVIITLKCSDDVDLARLTQGGKLLAGHQVKLELYPRRMMLYICGIPLHYTHEMYVNFLSRYGEVETAFLSRTDNGDSLGYGFAEFAHNRATLEKVRQRIHGSTLECSVLYCDLVPDTVLSYNDTQSNTLYCVCDKETLPTDPQLLTALQQYAKVFSMGDSSGKVVYILECPSVELSQQLWYYSRSLPTHTTSQSAEKRTISFHYAMPALSPHQIAQIITNTKRKYPTVDNKMETRFVLMEIFPDNPELVIGIEGLLSQMESQLHGQPLTTNVIMNLASLLNLSKAPQVLPNTSVPPPCLMSMPPPPPAAGLVNTSLLRPSVRPLQPVNRQVDRPITRARAAAVSQTRHENLIASECEKRLRVTARQTRSRQGSAGSHTSQSGSSCEGSGDENTYYTPAADQRVDNRVMLPVVSPCEVTPVEEQHSHLRSCSGPMTRQRRRTLEKALTPYRKTPGTKSKKRERPLVFEVDLNQAITDLFSTKRQTMSTTPKVLRRLLPEPEVSPETPRFIGQHSQGIGGHYADSYVPAALRAARAASQGLFL